MSKEFLHMRSSKSQEFWLPVTDYPRAFRSFRRRIAGSGYETGCLGAHFECRAHSTLWSLETNYFLICHH